MNYDLVVFGSGPGGYTSAFRAADLGMKVGLVERHTQLGGVCLNVGCIPSKTLLHVARVISEVRDISEFGVDFGEKHIDLRKLIAKKDSVVSKLTKGLAGLAKQRQVDVLTGKAMFVGSNEAKVDAATGSLSVTFEQAIVATGSSPTKLSGLPDDPRIINSTGALDLENIPERLLVIGGGIIGLEMASVYAELGSRVTIVELTPNLMFGADQDLVMPLENKISKRLEAVYKETQVVAIDTDIDALVVSLDGADAPSKAAFDKVLVAVGREPNGSKINSDTAGLVLSDKGFIEVDGQMRTNVSHIYAIGDVVGAPMLAHKAAHQGKVAAEAAAGLKSFFEPKGIPSVAYTDPEVAWVGLTEDDAIRTGTRFSKGIFPWSASGRSLSMGRTEGLTKLIFDEKNNQIIGGGIVGSNAGDLIAEVGLAIEMGSDVHDLGLTIHPHPTLAETISNASEVSAGTVTDLYLGGTKSD